MSTVINLPFALGEVVWHAAHDYERWWIQCPECLGTKEIKVTLATGEEYALPCANCSRGYESANGKVEHTEYRYKPRLFTPQRFFVDDDGVSYSESGPEANCYTRVKSENLFKSKDDCAARCDEENIRAAAHWQDQQLRHLMHKRKDYAWSVHYWRRQRADKVKEIERIDQRLIDIRARSRSTTQRQGDGNG